MTGEVEQGSLKECVELQGYVSVLRDSWKRSDFGQEYREALLNLEKRAPEQVETILCFAALAMAQGAWREALSLAEEAYQRRKMSRAVWRMLQVCHTALGDRKAAFKYRCLLSAVGEEPWEIVMSDVPEGGQDILRAVFTSPWSAPFVSQVKEKDGGKVFDYAPLLAEALPYAFEEEPQEFSYHAGIYGEESEFALLDDLASNLMAWGCEEGQFIARFNVFWFDILRAAEKKHAAFHRADVPCVVPLMGKGRPQTVRLRTGAQEVGVRLAPRETRLVRLEEPCRLSAQEPFLMGHPVKLEHRPKRRKLVLNILADGLSWPAQRLDGYKNVPNIMRFFSQGVIFENCWSPAEYTYPSLPAIETGLYPHKSQIFERDLFMRLEKKYRPISEKMRDLGYYTVNLMGSSEGVINGATRGFERLIVNLSALEQANTGVVRTMKHLDAFRETDMFILLHVSDAHPYDSNIALPENIQARFSFDAFRPNVGVPSVFLQASHVMRETNRWKVRMLDRELGILFDYLEENYAPEEYIVHLYSDHGVSVYDDDWLLADTHVGASLMVRGAGVPQLGQVTELASSLDLYKIMSKTCGFFAEEPWLDSHLPESFGGTRREYVVSNSIYPGQTYKLAIRTEEHEFRLETEAPTAPDGTADMAHFTYQIRTREETPRIVRSPELSRYFLEIAHHHTKPFWDLHL